MVNTSLFSGLSGLRAHQQYIDIIGNNLANVSTPGFWGARMTFSDILSFTQTAGSGPSGNFGGTNPRQVGLGVGVGSIDLRTEQGTFQDTGRSLDVALQGRGFFTLNDGLRNLYTRVGTFGVDANRNLVDLRTGYRVVNASGADITVPVTDTLPPRATSEVTFQGNLPAEVSGPLEEIVTSSSPFLEGTSANKTTTVTGTFTIPPALVNKSILVSVNGGAQQTVTFTQPTYTAAALEAVFDAAFPSGSGLTATVTGGGALQLDTVKLGATAKLRAGPEPAVARVEGAGVPQAKAYRVRVTTAGRVGSWSTKLP